MKLLFKRIWSSTFTTGGTGYILSDPVPVGHIVSLANVYACSPERDSADKIVIGIKSGGVNYTIEGQAPGSEIDGISGGLGNELGEGDQVFGYFPDAENNDSLELHVMGVLMTLAEWQGV